jgi:multiple sugar transport system ATP-binding protein
MATIKLDGVSKVYPNGVEAVSELDLEIAEGEFMILVGPSGCGKTTALRMVAGLEDITGGTVEVGGRVVNELSPRDRDIAMVFQNYALYPHMTVAENIGFALTLRKLAKSEIEAKVQEAAKILGLTEHLGRKPAQLSGGQRQRVAMGRAIVREPAAFLMDEPLSNLDAKLRVQTRAEISRIQRRLGVATLYVTHDQTEAMTMGDRVAVMRSGRLQQCDTPQTLYDAPANLFVAAFMGSPPMNLYHATVDVLELPEHLRAERAIGAHRGRDVVVGVRPEDLVDAAVADTDGAGRRLEGTVDLVEALGAEKLIHFHIDANRVQAMDTGLGAEEGDAEGLAAGEIGAATMTAGVARVPPTSKLRADERAVFQVDTNRLHLFEPDSGVAISATPPGTIASDAAASGGGEQERKPIAEV